MQITLRIKKRYFDEIVNGTKTVEYRDARPYYDRMLGKPGITHVKLHYQRPRQCIVEVRGICKIRTPQTPEFLEDKTSGISSHVYCISLGKVQLIEGEKE